MTESIEILLNGHARRVIRGSTIAEVVSLITAETKGVAVALDEEVVTRSMWATTCVEAGSRVEVLNAASGG